MKTKTQIIILVFCIIILLVLSISIYAKGYDNSCDKCQIDFTTTQQSGAPLDNPWVTTVNITDLYHGILEDKCIIKWDRVQGYYE